MVRITQEMIEKSYEYGEKYAYGEISLDEAVEQIIKTGMNKGSAKNSLYNMKCLLNEKVYFYAMSANETIWRLERIKNEYGLDKYLRVLNIVEKHLETKKSPNYKIREYLIKNKKICD